MFASSPLDETSEPAVRRARLDRLRLVEADRTSTGACLRVLRDAGLHAEPSRIDPGGLIGGVDGTAILDRVAFGEPFIIRPAESGYAVAVPGPGTLATEERTSTLREAVERVVAIFRARGRIPSAP